MRACCREILGEFRFWGDMLNRFDRGDERGREYQPTPYQMRRYQSLLGVEGLRKKFYGE